MVLLYLISWVLLSPLFTFFHELGHAGMYQFFTGKKDWHIYIGSGTPVMQFGRITINKWFVFSGYVTRSEILLSRWKQVLISAAGFMVNILFVILLYNLSWYLYQWEINMRGSVSSNVINALYYFQNGVLLIAGFINVLMALFTMIPTVYPYGFSDLGGSYSDGLKIFYLFFPPKETDEQSD